MESPSGPESSAPSTACQQARHRKTRIRTPKSIPGVTGPRELVHGERESFIGEYRWQRSGLAVGSPAMNAGGGLFYVLSSGLWVGVVLGVEPFKSPVEMAG